MGPQVPGFAIYEKRSPKGAMSPREEESPLLTHLSVEVILDFGTKMMGKNEVFVSGAEK